MEPVGAGGWYGGFNTGAEQWKRRITVIHKWCAAETKVLRHIFFVLDRTGESIMGFSANLGWQKPACANQKQPLVLRCQIILQRAARFSIGRCKRLFLFIKMVKLKIWISTVVKE